MAIELIDTDHADGGQPVAPYLVRIDDEHYAKIDLGEPNNYDEAFWRIKVLGPNFDDDWQDGDYGEDWSGYLGHTDDPLDAMLPRLERICHDNNLI